MSDTQELTDEEVDELMKTKEGVQRLIREGYIRDPSKSSAFATRPEEMFVDDDGVLNI